MHNEIDDIDETYFTAKVPVSNSAFCQIKAFKEERFFSEFKTFFSSVASLSESFVHDLETAFKNTSGIRLNRDCLIGQYEAVEAIIKFSMQHSALSLIYRGRRLNDFLQFRIANLTTEQITNINKINQLTFYSFILCDIQRQGNNVKENTKTLKEQIQMQILTGDTWINPKRLIFRLPERH